MMEEENTFLNEENAKYVNCCAVLMYFYLKSENEKINVNEVAGFMGENTEENLFIIKRVLGGLNKNIRFNNVTLSYSDYLWLDRVVKDNKNYRFQLFPFIISICAFAVSFASLLFSSAAKPLLMLLCIAIALFAIYYIYKISD